MENGCLEDYTPEIQHTYPKYPYVKGDSLPETNMAPENQWLEDEFPFGMAPFSGAMLVFGRVHVPKNDFWYLC